MSEENSSESEDPVKKKAPGRARKRYYAARLRLFRRIALLIPLCLMLFAGVWFYKVWTDAGFERERIALEKQRIELARDSLAKRPAPPDNVKNSAAPPNEEQGDTSQPQDSAVILKNFVASGRTSGQAAAVPALLGLLDDLVKAGTVPVEAASDLRKAIQEKTLDGVKEITVEVAKGLIDRYIKPHEAHEPSGGAGESHNGSITQTNNNYCEVIEAPQPGPIHHPSTPPHKPHPKPPVLCGKS